MLSKNLVLRFLQVGSTIMLTVTVSCLNPVNAQPISENYYPKYSLRPPVIKKKKPDPPITAAYFDLNIIHLYSTSPYYNLADIILPCNVNDGSYIKTITIMKAIRLKPFFPQLNHITVGGTFIDRETGESGEWEESDFSEWPNASSEKVPWKFD